MCDASSGTSKLQAEPPSCTANTPISATSNLLHSQHPLLTTKPASAASADAVVRDILGQVVTVNTAVVNSNKAAGSGGLGQRAPIRELQHAKLHSMHQPGSEPLRLALTAAVALKACVAMLPASQITRPGLGALCQHESGQAICRGLQQPGVGRPEC